MKVKDLIQGIVKNYDRMDDDTWEKIVYMAYYIGRERAAKEVSDKYNALLHKQIERALKCRYHKMAMQVQGNVDYVYTSDYAQDMTELFGDDKTNITTDYATKEEK